MLYVLPSKVIATSLATAGPELVMPEACIGKSRQTSSRMLSAAAVAAFAIAVVATAIWYVAAAYQHTMRADVPRMITFETAARPP